MPVLREIVTRFKFETDKKGVNSFNLRIREMKRGVGGLTRLFGVGIGVASVRSLFKMGIALDKARFNLERLGGVNTKQLEKNFKGIQSSMENIRQGSGQVLRLRDFFSAGAGFFKIFGKGAKQNKDFLRTFEFAAKLSAITGENVGEIFQKIAQGIESGDFSFLAEVPGFTRTRIQRITDLLKRIDPGEFGGEVGRQQRLGAFLKEAGKASGQINKDLAKVPEAMLQADRTATQFADSMDKVAKILTDTLVPAIEQVGTLLAGINQFLGITRKIDIPTTARGRKRRGLAAREEVDIPAAIGSFFKQNILAGPGTGETTRGRNRRLQTDISRTEKVPAPDAGRVKSLLAKPKDTGETLDGRGKDALAGATFNTTYNINGATDPELVASEVTKKFKETIRQAGRAIVPTEEK